MRELNEIRTDPPPNISVCPVDENNPYYCLATIMGPDDSPYAGGVFFLNIQYPLDYPYLPPKINFTTRVYHPNIDSNGHICVNFLMHEWTPSLTIRMVLLSI